MKITLKELKNHKIVEVPLSYYKTVLEYIDNNNLDTEVKLILDAEHLKRERKEIYYGYEKTVNNVIYAI
jgi:hypothetical protein